MIFAASFVVRPEVQTAKQTSQLHKRPRRNSSHAGSDIFMAATFPIRSACGPLDRTPDWTTSQASASEPMRLPTQDHTLSCATWVQVRLRESPPITPIMLFPVNNSDPAKITNVRAIPKDTPITSLTIGDPTAASGPPRLKINAMPNPT